MSFTGIPYSFLLSPSSLADAYQAKTNGLLIVHKLARTFKFSFKDGLPKLLNKTPSIITSLSSPSREKQSLPIKKLRYHVSIFQSKKPQSCIFSTSSNKQLYSEGKL